MAAPQLFDEHDPFHDPEADALVEASLGKFPSKGHQRFKPQLLDPMGNSGAKSSTKSKASYRETKSLDYLASQGYFAFKVTCQAVTYMGVQYTRDLLGFADILAIKEGKCLLVQVTSKADIGSHCREMADPKNKKQSGVPRANIERWIEMGGAIEVHGWEQDEKGKYHLSITQVDVKLLELYDSRRRT